MQLARVRQPWLAWDDTALRRGLGVYVHIPFCLARCNYCDFLTYGSQRPPGLEPGSYCTALLEEIDRRGGWAREYYGGAGRVVDTVFIGGGTPTFLEPGQLASIVRAVLDGFPLAENAVEVTVEANPETLSAQYLDTLAKAGVNRLSVGVQASQDSHLRRLRRPHAWGGILSGLDALRRGPIRRYSFDVMYGLPRLTCAELKQTLRRLLAYRPEHISAYELTYEPGTPLTRLAGCFPELRAGDNVISRQQRLFERTLAGYGMYRYEVSNYARPGAESRHNLRYWLGGDYCGLGLGAAARLGAAVINNPRGWAEYRQHCGKAGRANDPLVQAAGNSPAPPLAPPADAFLRLRTRAGLGAYPPGSLDARWLERGWFTRSGDGLALASLGLNYADTLALRLG